MAKVTCSVTSYTKYLVTGGTPMGKSIPVHEKIHPSTSITFINAVHNKQSLSTRVVFLCTQ